MQEPSWTLPPSPPLAPASELPTTATEAAQPHAGALASASTRQHGKRALEAASLPAARVRHCEADIQQVAVPIPTELRGDIGSLIGMGHRHLRGIQQGSGAAQIEVEDSRNVVVHGSPDAIQAAQNMLEQHFARLLEKSERSTCNPPSPQPALCPGPISYSCMYNAE